MVQCVGVGRRTLRYGVRKDTDVITSTTGVTDITERMEKVDFSEVS